MGHLEYLGVGVVLGRKNSPVLETFDGHVNSVELVLLRAGQVEDDDGLVVVGVRDIANLSVGEHDGVVKSDKKVGEERLPLVSVCVVDPVDVSGIWIDSDEVPNLGLPGAEHGIGELFLLVGDSTPCNQIIIDGIKIVHVAGNNFGAIRINHELLENGAFLKHLHNIGKVGTAAHGNPGAEFEKIVVVLGAILGVVDVISSASRKPVVGEILLAHSGNGGLLEHLYIALLVGAIGRWTDLVAMAEIPHGCRIELNSMRIIQGKAKVRELHGRHGVVNQVCHDLVLYEIRKKKIPK